ncbi:MAG: ATP-binding cassette domain-containing protein, partial [Acidobacteria bacterium]|nr:ATP-binding cassette domain-containing protein [Acidobacteriota bacterium]
MPSCSRPRWPRARPSGPGGADTLAWSSSAAGGTSGGPAGPSVSAITRSRPTSGSTGTVCGPCPSSFRRGPAGRRHSQARGQKQGQVTRPARPTGTASRERRRDRCGGTTCVLRHRHGGLSTHAGVPGRDDRRGPGRARDRFRPHARTRRGARDAAGLRRVVGVCGAGAAGPLRLAAHRLRVPRGRGHGALGHVGGPWHHLLECACRGRGPPAGRPSGDRVGGRHGGHAGTRLEPALGDQRAAAASDRRRPVAAGRCRDGGLAGRRSRPPPSAPDGARRPGAPPRDGGRSAARVHRHRSTGHRVSGPGRGRRGGRLDQPHRRAPRGLAVTGAVLSLRAVAVRYRGREVFHGVSGELPAGHALGVVGASGSGKTSLLRTIAGLMRPAAGEIRVHGRLPQSSRARAGLAYFAGEASLPGSVRASAWGRLSGGDAATAERR